MQWKKRPLSIPIVKDKTKRSLFMLQPIEETTDEHSYGFRLHKNCHDAYEQIFEDLSLRNSAQWVLEGSSKEILEKMEVIVVEFMKERGLSLFEEETLITNVKEGFAFLGWNFRKITINML